MLLASVVTYFAINVFSTRVQEESLSLMKQHIWVNSTATEGSMSSAEASLMIVNSGGRDVVLQKLAIRGQDVQWNSTDSTWNSSSPDERQQVVLYCITKNSVSQDMPYEGNFNVTGKNQVTFGTTNYNFTVASSPLTLESGYSMLLYVVNPDSITVNDVGLTASMTVYTAQTMYYVESNVQTIVP